MSVSRSAQFAARVAINTPRLERVTQAQKRTIVSIVSKQKCLSVHSIQPFARPSDGCDTMQYRKRSQNPCRNASTDASSQLKQTPLYALHEKAGAKFGPFAGYDMPLTYKDQSHPESHRWTRENASLFDVSHMVQHKLSGPMAEEFLMTITPSSLNTLGKHHSTLSVLLNDQGGIVDDTVITRLGRDSFYFVTNAGCRENDLKYLKTQMREFIASKGLAPKDMEENLKWHILECHSLLALQGPKAAEVLQKLVYVDEEDPDSDYDLAHLGFGQSVWLQLTIPDVDCKDNINTPSLLISRTGYTGEDGFEISIPGENGDSKELASLIAKAVLGDQTVVRWAGLAARDSLRLEAGMCLYGHDINEDTTPPMAALGWVVGKDRRSDSASPSFRGQSVILEQLTSPKKMTQRRVGLKVEKGSAAREGAEIVSEDGGEIIGKVTSGCPSPSLDGANIAMGLIKNGFHKSGTKVGVKVRNKVRSAEVSRLPFLKDKFYRPDSKDPDGKQKEALKEPA